MSDLSQKLTRSLAAVFGLALAAPPVALAQIAPVGGDHYAARESDTGFAGAVNAGGSYGASVPLDLPGARGGLRVPVSVVYGGRRFGAAGLGWDVPLSSIRRDGRIAHRRPANMPDVIPQSREQLTLDGTVLVRKADETGWVRRNDAQLEVRDAGDGVHFDVYDGNGLHYSFSSKPFGASQPLDGGNLYLLEDIFGQGGTHVHLAYTFGTPTLAGGVTGLSIDLASVSYNYDSATGSCAKHQVNLVYEANASSPLSLAMLGNKPLVRMHKLHAVDVKAREVAANSQQPCSGPMRSLRTYNLDYQNDADTGQSQLRRVTMLGQETSDERNRNLTLPVATYTYGQVTGSDGKLTYTLRQQIASTSLPSSADTGFAIASTTSSTASADGSSTSNSYQNLIDIDGDGRPDLLSSWASDLALNKPDPANPQNSVFTRIFAAPGTQFRGYQTGLKPRQTDIDSSRNSSQVWVQMIDMNADGRLDVVVANEKSNFWVVYLNKPALHDPLYSIAWEKRYIDIRPLLPILPNTPGTRMQNSDGVYLALSSTVSGHDQAVNHCWQWTGTKWSENPQGFNKASEICTGPTWAVDASDRTITQWQLSDINGDGYPDLVFNTAAVDQIDTGDTGKPTDPGQRGQIQWAQNTVIKPFDFVGSNQLKAVLNVAGVHLASSGDERVFSAPILLETSSNCGVSRFSSNVDSNGRNGSYQECGFADINGDGLPDRVNQSTVRFGTGDPNAPFSNATMPLPGPLSISVSALDSIDFAGHYRPHACFTQRPDGNPLLPAKTYPVQRTVGYNDLNGDGIPDYVEKGSGGWTVRFGTGVGFAAAKPIVSTGGVFELSLEKVGCFPDNTSSGTSAGLWDFFGEGQPAFVALSGNALNVYSPSAGGVTGLPAGLLTRIDNGYGASTTITYRSAKEDANTNHLVPSPEVVVTSVTTQNQGQSLSPALYAYGNASQYFDSALDRWVFPGYRRKVSLQNAGNASDPGAGNAVITDALPLDPFDLNVVVDPTTRLLRYLKAGRVSDVTMISGELGTNPWALLATDVTTDARRVGASHSAYTISTTQLLPAGKTGNEYCIDMLDPYDYTGSLTYKDSHESFDQCAQRGFALRTSMNSWRGTPGTAAGTADVISSPQIVQTASSITAFDSSGRVTDTTSTGDLTDPATKLCTHVDYASPQTSPVRVLNAIKQQTVTPCGTNAPILAKKSFEYDGLKADKAGQVASGFITSSTVTRYDGDTHAPLGDDIKLFDTTVDANGNPLTITKTRNDGAQSTTTFSNYDPFGFVATNVSSSAVDPIGGPLPAIYTSVTPDTVAPRITSATDANGTVSGATYDGFGRLTRSKVTPPGGTEGVLSTTTYTGFELIDTNGDGIPDAPDPTLGGRSITTKAFQDAVPEANVVTAPGRIGTVFLDSLGRANTTKTNLGANYANKVATFRSYDALGRINFKSDPYEENVKVPLYGTSYNYNTDGTPSCFVRGPGTQPASAAINETNEVYPTCFSHSFASNQEILQRSDADSFLTGSNQFGVVNKTTRNAIGRVLEQKTVSGAGAILKDVAFAYDALGHRTSMTRYQDPINKAKPVMTTWHPDSLGWVTSLDKTGVATQSRTFDSWGNVTQVQWCDDMSAAPCPTKDRSNIARYDARNRLVHREDRDNNSGGHAISGTAVDLTYDVNSGALPFVPRNNMLGRLASATWSTGQEWFTYDAFGRVNSRSFIDTSVPSNDHHYEIHEFHDDGSEKTLHLALRDTNGQDEQVNYGYDSAGRVNSMVYNFGANPQTLFSASGNSPIYDAFGRINSAKYGLAGFNATYAAAGRRLLNSVMVAGNPDSRFADSRSLVFQPLPPALNISHPYDPIGRKRAWLESRPDPDSADGEGSIVSGLTAQYDGLGRLSRADSLTAGAGGAIGADSTRTFSYDPLNNIATQTDTDMGRPGSVSLSYGAPDLDRVCGVGYAGVTAPQSPCNVGYDGAGNTVAMPTRTGSTRTLDFFPNGAVKSITDGGSNASFAYDAFGALQQLTVYTTNADRRADKNFGVFVKQRIEGSQSVINRRIPIPGGGATLHGAMTGKWTFAFGQARGTRFVTDKAGNFVQDINYQPFGEVKNPAGATPGTTNYENEQWNGGDLLAALGVVNLGARIYDPVIGRFLSRDPILQADNPYSFAGNDPVNSSDPTGMLQECISGSFLDVGCSAGGGSLVDGSAGGGSLDGGVLSHIGNSGASDPFGDHGFTQNGGTSLSGAGIGDPWGRGGWRSYLRPDDGATCDESGCSSSTGFYCNELCRFVRAIDALNAALPPIPDLPRNSFVPPANFGVDMLARWGLPACRGNSACPAHWDGTTPPPGFGPYFSRAGEVGYHCSGHVFVETGCKSSEWDITGTVLHGECNYASDTTCGVKVGDIITKDNPLCGGCYGNADRFDSRAGLLDFIGHGILDEGGPMFGGFDHWAASSWHAAHPNEPMPAYMLPDPTFVAP